MRGGHIIALIGGVIGHLPVEYLQVAQLPNLTETFVRALPGGLHVKQHAPHIREPFIGTIEDF
jgi:hypothetical protein